MNALTREALPPGPKRPPIAQAFAWAYRPIPFLEMSRRKYGETFCIQFPRLPTEVVFSNPEHIKQIFTGPGDKLYAGQVNSILEPLVGSKSLLLLDGKRHLQERRLLLPPFHGERMQTYCHQMTVAADRMIERLPDDGVFAVHTFTQEFTLDVILSTVFGLTEGARFQRLQSLLAKLLDSLSNPMLLSKVFQIDLGRHSPWGKVKRINEEINLVLRELIDECRQNDDGSRTDVLAMLAAARYEDGRQMSYDELRDELITILVAGHETTATALAWSVNHILSTPEVLPRLRAEIYDVTKGDKLQVKHLSSLKYLDGVVKETLRLLPVIPMVGRVLQEPMMIGDYMLPKGVSAVPCIYLAHRRPEVYPEPEKFIPERFMKKPPGPYEFFPFGGGIRRCVGAAFALYEMKIWIAQVFSKLELQLEPSYVAKVRRRSITLTPEKGVLVQVQKRLHSESLAA